jgi:hypothetical protein
MRTGRTHWIVRWLLHYLGVRSSRDNGILTIRSGEALGPSITDGGERETQS